MSQAPNPPEPSGREGRDTPPSWAGAPGFTPYQDVVMPHAPMPGAPPYPPAVAPPPAAPRPPGLTTGRAFAVAATWAAVSVVAALVIGGAPSPGDLGLFLLALGAPTLLTALAVRFVGRVRAWPFWLLVVVAAPFFWVLRALQNLIFW
jgi:hypothetical protein